MTQAKVELFDKDLQEGAELFKALGHPARLAILKFLAEIKMCYTGNISDELPLGRTTVNQHLKELKKVGLIHGNILGSRTSYCLNPEKIGQLESLSLNFIQKIKN
jgi:DNA-binding transcriptional ArsR family regulator